jgi:hypothetical protein
MSLLSVDDRGTRQASRNEIYIWNIQGSFVMIFRSFLPCHEPDLVLLRNRHNPIATPDIGHGSVQLPSTFIEYPLSATSYYLYRENWTCLNAFNTSSAFTSPSPSSSPTIFASASVSSVFCLCNNMALSCIRAILLIELSSSKTSS